MYNRAKQLNEQKNILPTFTLSLIFASLLIIEKFVFGSSVK